MPGGTFRDALNLTKKEQENVIDLCRKTLTRLTEAKTQLKINLNSVNQNQDVIQQTSQSKVPPVEHPEITENEIDTK